MAMALALTRWKFEPAIDICRLHLGLHGQQDGMAAERRLQQLHFPHAPLVSTYNQPSSPHLASLALCFLPSVPRDQGICVKRRGYRSIKGSSCLACSPICQQKSAGQVWLWLAFPAESTWTPRWARWQISVRTLRGCCVGPQNHLLLYDCIFLKSSIHKLHYVTHIILIIVILCNTRHCLVTINYLRVKYQLFYCI